MRGIVTTHSSREAWATWGKLRLASADLLPLYSETQKQDHGHATASTFKAARKAPLYTFERERDARLRNLSVWASRFDACIFDALSQHKQNLTKEIIQTPPLRVLSVKSLRILVMSQPSKNVLIPRPGPRSPPQFPQQPRVQRSSRASGRWLRQPARHA